MHHIAADVPAGNAGAWSFPEGGMGAVSQSIRRAAQSHGAEVRTNARVARILTRADGTAEGVVLESGEEIRAPWIVTSIHPRLTFLNLLDSRTLPDEFVRDIEAWRSRSGSVKVNLALSELPDFLADPGSNQQEHHTGYLEYCVSMDHVERAFLDARAGRPASVPYGDANIPTTLDRSLMPKGTHMMSIFSQYVPHDWSLEPHREELESYADRLIDGYAQLAPNLKASIIARQVIGPYDMEQDLGMVGGNIFHGELAVDQLFHMRPTPGYADYRTPVPGLYHASSATHGGGGVTGIPGYQAVRQLLHDRKRRAKRGSRG
jgi:phytoene dehydrogenase-like protein